MTGQGDAYLAEFLLKKGYEVHGIKRRSQSAAESCFPLPLVLAKCSP